MSDEVRTKIEDREWKIEDGDTILHPRSSILDSQCSATGEGHCVTCSDEALPARVLSVDLDTSSAQALVNSAVTEVDISLVDGIEPGMWLLVHGGVALSCLGEAGDAQ